MRAEKTAIPRAVRRATMHGNAGTLQPLLVRAKSGSTRDREVASHETKLKGEEWDGLRSERECNSE